MSVEVLCQVGGQSLANGVKAMPSLAQDGALIVQDDFAAAVERGRCFAVCNQSGVTSQAGLSGTTPTLTLYNPSGSGVNGRLWFAGATFTVAFATAGAVWLAANINVAAAAVTGTITTTHVNLKLAGTGAVAGAQGNRITALTAATLPAAPIGICLLGVGLTGAITTIPHLQTLGRWFNGGVMLMPGTALSIQTGVASGASGTFCEYMWEEVDA